MPFSLHLPPEDASPQIYTFTGDLLPSKEAERLSYLSHSVTFERLHSQSQASDSVSPNTSVYSVLEDTKAGEGIWKGVEEKERETLLGISQQWTGWTGASLDKVSFKYWGFEQEFPGEDAIVKEGYGSLIDYYRKVIERLGGEIKLETIVDEVVKNEDEDLISVNEKWRSKFVVCSLPLGECRDEKVTLHGFQLIRLYFILSLLVLYRSSQTFVIHVQTVSSTEEALFSQKVRNGTARQASTTIFISLVEYI